MFTANIINLFLKFLKNVAAAGKIKTFDIINRVEKFKTPSNGEKPFLIMYIFADRVNKFKIIILTASM